MYFQTIQSILNGRIFHKQRLKVGYFQTIQSILNVGIDTVSSYASNSFPNYSVYFKLIIRTIYRNKFIPNFQTIQSILNTCVLLPFLSPKKNFQTIQSILNTLGEINGMNHPTIFPNYSVYFKLMILTRQLKAIMVDFQTIQSILNFTIIGHIFVMYLLYFQTIQSILNWWCW